MGQRWSIRTAAGLWLAACLSTGVIWLFVHNSGYGYDALEYLTVGRSIRDGVPFYTFVPSKSWALYYMTAAFLRIPGAASHVGVSILVVGIWLGVIALTFVVVRSRFGVRPAALASVLVGVAALFMELNCLQPEGFVYAAGLCAVAAATRPDASARRMPWLVAGLAIAAGAAFKTVAIAYLLGFVAWLVLRSRIDRQKVDLPSWSKAGWIVAGCTLGLAGQALAFWMTGRLADYIEWSFVFPIRHYPAHTLWLSTLYTKLAWVWLIVAAAAVLSRRRAVRDSIDPVGGMSLLFLVGIFGLLPLLKTQASHYAFPGAACLLVYAAIVFDRAILSREGGVPVGRALVFAGALALICLATALVYRPGLLVRFAGFRSFTQEDSVRRVVQGLVGPGEFAISLGTDSGFYWSTDTLPNWPVLHTDVQTTYLIERRGSQMLAALDDPRLVLVEYAPGAAAFDDATFVDHPANRRFLRELECRLRAGFTRRDDLIPGAAVWSRPPHPMGPPTSAACGL